MTDDKKENQTINALVSDALDRLDIFSDHAEIEQSIDDIKVLLNDLVRKEKMIQVIETFALTSDDANVISLREDLYTTVKLIHGEEINKTVSKMCRDENITDTGPTMFMGTSASASLAPGSLYINTQTGSLTTGCGSTISIGACDNVDDTICNVEDRQHLWGRIKKKLATRKNNDG